MIKSIGKNAAALGFVAVICVGLLTFINQQTASRINEQRLNSKLNLLLEVVPKAEISHELLKDCVMVTHELLGRPTSQAIYRLRQNGQVSAYILETTAPDGYSGNIDLLVATTPDGTILGTRVLDHKETPGLGDKIEVRRAPWILSFNGMQVSEDNRAIWAVKKEGGTFDQFTGATITPRAVINAVRKAAEFVQQYPEQANALSNCSL